MAKVFKSNLPKVISVANKEISTLIESDIASESQVLKGLVDQVLKANIEVKKKNNLRITETKRRINELDNEISKLNISIDDVDRDTVIKQLNEMIDAENTIFNSRQEIRFFDNENTKEKLNSIDELHNKLVTSIKEMYNFEISYQRTLGIANSNLFDKQYEITNQITNMMNEVFERRGNNISVKLDEFRFIEDKITELEFDFLDKIKAHIKSFYELNSSSSASFTEVDNKESLQAQIEQDHILKVESLETQIKEVEDNHQELIKELNKNIKLERERIHSEIYTDEDEPVVISDSKEEKLHDIRLKIMDAEKRNDLTLVSKLLKQFEKIDKAEFKAPKDKKSIEFNKKFGKFEREFKTNLLTANIEFAKLNNKLEYELAEEKINIDEARILHKIKFDREALNEYKHLSTDQIDLLRTTLRTKLNSLREIFSMKKDLRISELQVMKNNELLEIELVEAYRSLLSGIKELEHFRKSTIVEDINAYDSLKVNQKKLVKKDIELFKLNSEIYKIDRTIVEYQNEAKIKAEVIKEDANSEIIYQESLLEIAKKEHELQLIKVESLYENEKTLAEDQINRISMGLKVNDAFVKTTLNNQLSFAKQQIKLAESEFEIRVESINLTRSQELTYATKKIDLFKHKYEYEISKLEKERDANLEDLKYKLLLFRDEKENRDLQNQINSLQNTYGDMIKDIAKVEKSDPEIIRYQKVVDEANNRADEAIKEAQLVKDQMISSFEKLRDETILKFENLNLSENNENSTNMIPALNNNIINSAEERLQKALSEAKELYEDKIKDPMIIIEENKKILSQTDSSEELDNLIKELELKKDNLLIKYNEAIELIEEEFKANAGPLEDLLFKARAIKAMESEYIQDEMFEKIVYRDENIISADYDQLVEKELLIYNEKVNSITSSVESQLTGFNNLYKTLIADVTSTVKKYDSYIKFASKDVRRQKKALQKEVKNELKASLKDART